MMIEIRPTAKLVRCEDLLCRVWEGTTDRGVGCIVFVRVVAVPKEDEQGAFEQELIEVVGPAVEVPIRMVL